MSASIRRIGVLAAVFLVALHSAAVGQSAVDEELPRTFAQGLATGVGGAFFEYYNFAAIVGIGILAGIAARGIIPLLAFSAASVIGVAIQISPFDLPFDEIIVALTTIAIGALVVRRQSIHPQVASIFFSIAGLFHGYSLSESIVGAATAPLLAYVGGMLLVQIGVGTVACVIAIKISGRTTHGQPSHVKGLTIAGILVTIAGAIAAIQAMGLLG